MVRHTDADDGTEFELINDPDQIAVGDTIDVHGQDFLPKSNMTIDEVDPDWTDVDGTVFVASIDRKNARDYCFRITDGGFVETTDSAGRWGPSVTAKVDVTEWVEVDDLSDADDVDVDEGDRIRVEYIRGRSDVTESVVEGDVTDISTHGVTTGAAISFDNGDEYPDGEPKIRTVTWLGKVDIHGKAGEQTIGRDATVYVRRRRDAVDDDVITDGATDAEVEEAIEDVDIRPDAE